MKLDAGTIVTIVFCLLFYLRLIIIQRQRVKTARYQYAVVAGKNSKKKKAAENKPEVRYSRLGIHIRNWALVALAIALISFGAVVAATRFLGPSLSNFWWIPLNLGIVVFAIGIN
jgi:hypothetical protein